MIYSHVAVLDDSASHCDTETTTRSGRRIDIFLNYRKQIANTKLHRKIEKNIRSIIVKRNLFSIRVNLLYYLSLLGHFNRKATTKELYIKSSKEEASSTVKTGKLTVALPCPEWSSWHTKDHFKHSRWTL